VTQTELLEAVKDASNTSAPGLSASNYRLHKWAVELYPERFVRLYDACLRLGFHPHRWRMAVIAIVPKPRRADMSSPKSYRPIALLECMGKLLEKIVAKRLLF
ncbi:hypothetical protein BV25DRAFT_1779585, partial [Artomyces pyxidatus]